MYKDDTKAVEIAKQYAYEEPNHSYYVAACMEMAAWKKEQITEWLRKNIKNYIKRRVPGAIGTIDTDELIRDLERDNS